MKSHKWPWYATWMAILTVVWLVAFGHAEDFRSKYTDANGVNCCSFRDCIMAEVSLLTEPVGETVTVLVSFLELTKGQVLWRNAIMTLPVGSVHRSEDSRGYWCHKPGTQTSPAGAYSFGYSAGVRCGNPDFTVTEKCTRCVFSYVGT